jgi:site-specific DNA-cytosine methylase
MRVLELFAGIGGAAVALDGAGATVLAVDQDAAARTTYEAWHGTAPSARNLAHVKPAWLQAFGADLWWMSPPCQPYTIRGHQRDLEDRRSAPFLRVIEGLALAQPTALAMENVPWFQGSQGEALLRRTLEDHGYQVYTEVACPTALGIPMVRRRFYLVASRAGLRPPAWSPPPPRALATWLDEDPEPSLDVDAELAVRYRGALHIVDADDEQAITACFTGAYARSPVYAGSYLQHQGRLRHFSPSEIARLLGFGSRTFPEAIRTEQRYKLVGNSLAIPVVKRLLSRLPDLPDLR